MSTEPVDAGEFDFVVVGGYAVVAHGGTLVTQDLDVCCDFSADNLLRMQEALGDLHPVHPTNAPAGFRAHEASREVA